MVEFFKPYLVWLHLHPHWAGFAACLIAFTESLALVGLLIPGTVIMTAIGVLIGSGVIPFLSVALWAIIGAIAGDVLSYWLGRRYHQRIHQIWPFRRYPHLLDKGEHFFKEHGGKGIFIGRFIGPMRPVLPLIAGMMSMQPLRFLLVDTLSGILWAPAYFLPGILVGAASQELAPEATTRLLGLLVIALLIFSAASWAIKKIYHAFEASIRHVVSGLWTWIRRHPRLNRVDIYLRDPRYLQNHGQFALALFFVLVIVLFGVLTYSVTHHSLLTQWNIPLNYFMRTLRATFLDQLMVLITFFGEAKILLAMWSAVLVWLALKRNWWTAFHWALLGIGVVVSTDIVKKWIHFPRPMGLLSTPPDYSFPSGHSALSVAFYGFLAVLISYGRARIWQALTAIISCTIIIAIILSRLYLGVHWLTDVVGGSLLGLSWLCLMTVSYRRRENPLLPPAGVLIIAAFSLLLSWSWHFQKNYINALHNYTPYWPKYTVNIDQWWSQASQQVPRYRSSRFGSPTQIINVQWASTLTNIEQDLTQHGWHKQPRRNLVVLLSGLLSKDTSKQLPLLAQLYEDRRPVLVMTKFLEAEKVLVVLRLWDAHLKTETGLPLWLGTVGYHKASHRMLMLGPKEKDDVENTMLTPATKLLTQDLTGLDWQRIHYPQVPLAVQHAHIDWDGYVLYIRPAAAN